MPEWLERATPPSAAEELAAAGYPRLVARLLAQRGVTAATAADYFEPKLSGLGSPAALPGVSEAAEEILAAVRAGRETVVFGDYDCDGISGTAILVRTLQALSPAPVSSFLPRRLTEGYGMTDASVGRLLSEHPSVGLVVTVDNGINSVRHVDALRARGVAVVVTDHHLPGEVLPACTIVNPKTVAASGPFKDLCGAALAFLLAYRLMVLAKERGLYGGPSLCEPLLVLAGLATVTDLVPLTGLNRMFVSEALRRFNRSGTEKTPFLGAPAGLKTLLECASRGAERRHPAVTARDFGFVLGPRINAVGRLSTGMEALNLLLFERKKDETEAHALARVAALAGAVDACNDRRKAIVKVMGDDAIGRIEKGAAAQVIAFGEGHQGVAGIVASRVLEEVRDVPVCVVVQGHGSARAPAGYNVRDALAAAEPFLERYGGHAAAAGFTVREGFFDAFRAAFVAACARQRAEGGASAACEIDAWVGPEDLTPELVKTLRRMEPFGEGNPEPRFAMKGVVFSNVRPLGPDGRHLQATVAGVSAPMRAVWWTHGDRVEALRASPGPYDVLFSASASAYGDERVELRVHGIARRDML